MFLSSKVSFEKFAGCSVGMIAWWSVTFALLTIYFVESGLR